MPITLDFPPPLDEEITLEAEREGVPAADHATLLLYLASSLLRGEEPTFFQEAVKEFLSYHSLDAERVSSVFEELVWFCLEAARDEGQVSHASPKALARSPGTQQDPGPESVSFPLLRAWRSAMVHRPVDRKVDVLVTDRPRSATPVQRAGRVNRKRVSAYGKYAGIIPSSEEYMRERQKEIAREDGREE